MTPCAAPGCTSTRPSGRTYSRYCSSHRQRLRRHGDVNQRTITLSDLKRTHRAVAERIARSPDSPAWTLASERWRFLVDHCRAEMAMAARGIPYQRYDLRAAREIVRLAEEIDPVVVWRRVAEMYVLDHTSRSRYFASDRGFSFQLVRVVRQLGDVHFGMTLCRTTQRPKRWYRDLPPGVTERIAAMLAKTLGPVGMHFVKLERAIVDRADKEREALNAAFAEIAEKEAAD